MKKILSPIIYPLFIIPSMVGTLLLVIINGKIFHIGSSDTVVFILGLIIFGGISFWLGNKIMHKLENLKTPSIKDHLRQCFLFYLIAFVQVKEWFSAPSGQHGGLGYAYVFIFFVVSMWAILVNIVYLFRIRKSSSILSKFQ